MIGDGAKRVLFVGRIEEESEKLVEDGKKVIGKIVIQVFKKKRNIS